MNDWEVVDEHMRRDAVRDAQADVTLRHVEFKVIGKPVPQSGSKTARTAAGARVITTGGVGLREWRTQLAVTASEQRLLVGTFTGALGLDVTFRFRTPQTRLKTKAQRQVLVAPHSVTPDLDKLLRAVFDSLKQGGLIEDDARISSLTAFKCELAEDWVGVDVRLRELDSTDRYLW